MESQDLDKLLQSALAEFDNPNLLPSEKRANQRCDPVDLSETDRCGKEGTSAQQISTRFQNEEYAAENAKEIDEVLQSISQEDPELAKQLRNLTEFATNISSSDEEFAMKNFAQFATMFKSTLDTVSTSAGLQSEDVLDEDLNDIMRNLENLANESSDQTTSSELNDAVKALLSRDVMYDSLQRCVAEYTPWLSANDSKLSPEDAKKYHQQLTLVKQLIVEYDTHSNSKQEPQDKSQERHYQRLIELMASLQDLGDFPEDLMAKVDARSFQRKQGMTGSDSLPPDCKVS